MASRVSESLILRTYPYREADLIVSYFTRDSGKLRGIARRAKRTKSHYGSTLDRLAHVRLTYSQRDNRELSTIEGAELIASQFDLISGPQAYENSVVLDYISEVSELLLPPVEPNEEGVPADTLGVGGVTGRRIDLEGAAVLHAVELAVARAARRSACLRGFPPAGARDAGVASEQARRARMDTQDRG